MATNGETMCYLISKLRTDAALHLPPTTPYIGTPPHLRRASQPTTDSKFLPTRLNVSNGARADELNVVCILDEPDHETASTRLTFQL